MTGIQMALNLTRKHVDVITNENFLWPHDLPVSDVTIWRVPRFRCNSFSVA